LTAAFTSLELKFEAGRRNRQGKFAGEGASACGQGHQGCTGSQKRLKTAWVQTCHGVSTSK
jgi:hypothetical protein